MVVSRNQISPPDFCPGRPKNYFNRPNPESDAIQPDWQARCISEPFRLIFKSPKARIRCYILFSILNNARMYQKFILIGQTPNRVLFNPTDRPGYVRTIQNEIQNLNQLLLPTQFSTQCFNGPEYYHFVKYPESASIKPDWHSEWCPNHSE